MFITIATGNRQLKEPFKTVPYCLIVITIFILLFNGKIETTIPIKNNNIERVSDRVLYVVSCLQDGTYSVLNVKFSNASETIHRTLFYFCK